MNHQDKDYSAIFSGVIQSSKIKDTKIHYGDRMKYEDVPGFLVKMLQINFYKGIV